MLITIDVNDRLRGIRRNYIPTRFESLKSGKSTTSGIHRAARNLFCYNSYLYFVKIQFLTFKHRDFEIEYKLKDIMSLNCILK